MSKKIHDLPGHQSRIGCLAWNGDAVCSGSRDRFIIHRDMRDGNASERRLNAHRQEVRSVFSGICCRRTNLKCLKPLFN